MPISITKNDIQALVDSLTGDDKVGDLRYTLTQHDAYSAIAPNNVACFDAVIKKTLNEQVKQLPDNPLTSEDAFRDSFLKPVHQKIIQNLEARESQLLSGAISFAPIATAVFNVIIKRLHTQWSQESNPRRISF